MDPHGDDQCSTAKVTVREVGGVPPLPGSLGRPGVVVMQTDVPVDDRLKGTGGEVARIKRVLEAR